MTDSKYNAQELSDMTEIELVKAMRHLGNLYTNVASELRRRRFIEEMKTALADGL